MDPLSSTQDKSETGMVDDEDDDGKHTRVRWWINAARCVAAALVTALTVAVIARAVAVSLRSEKLYLRVLNGSVTAMASPPTSTSRPPTVKLSLTIWAYNPGGRAGVHYKGVNVSFLYHDGSPITWINMKDIEVTPETVRESSAGATLDVPSEVPMGFYQRMHSRGEIRNATVHLVGTLQTQVSGLNYTVGRTTEYRCSQVTIGASPQHTAGDVSCEEMSSIVPKSQQLPA